MEGMIHSIYPGYLIALHADVESEQAEKTDDRETPLPDDDPVVVEKMIQYLYTLDYCAPEEADTTTKTPDTNHDDDAPMEHYSLPPEEQMEGPTVPSNGPSPSLPPEEVGIRVEAAQEVNASESSESPLGQLAASQIEASQFSDPTFFHIQIYALAERFQVHGLKSLARRYFHDTLEHRLNSVSFTRVVEEAYSATPENDRGLRDAVVNIALNHLLELRRSNALSDEFLKGDGKKNRDFARDLCVAIIHRDERALN